MKNIKSLMKKRYGFNRNIIVIIIPIFMMFFIYSCYTPIYSSDGSNKTSYGKENAPSPWLFYGFTIVLLIGGVLMWFMKVQTGGLVFIEKIYSIKGDLRTKGKLSGSFFLGCGTVSGSSEEIDYYTYFKEGDYGLVRDKRVQSEVELIQTDSIEPCYMECLVDNETKSFIVVPSRTVKKNIKIEI